LWQIWVNCDIIVCERRVRLLGADRPGSFISFVPTGGYFFRAADYVGCTSIFHLLFIPIFLVLIALPTGDYRHLPRPRHSNDARATVTVAARATNVDKCSVD